MVAPLAALDARTSGDIDNSCSQLGCELANLHAVPGCSARYLTKKLTRRPSQG